MKKHTEGYVMIYVLVVMVLLALVATGVLSVSLNNLKAQKAAGDRMQELYTAEGVAEQIFSELKGCSTGQIGLDSSDIAAVEAEMEADGLSDEEKELNRSYYLDNYLLHKTFQIFEENGLQAIKARWNVGTNSLQIVIATHEDGSIQYDAVGNPFYFISFSVQEAETQIDTELRVTLKKEWQSAESAEDDLLTISTDTVNYLSYEIKTGVAA